LIYHLSLLLVRCCLAQIQLQLLDQALQFLILILSLLDCDL
jgi:hypothetical protein